jgi:ribosomal-protein-alanine N-acetyltransferase
MSIITQTTKLVVREFLAEEMETYLAHFTDEEVALHLPKRNREERIGFFNNALSQYPVTRTTGIWGMFDADTAEFIGSCLLRPFNDDPTILELGYSMEKKYWGRGIGTEMSRAMISHGFADPTINEIVACTTLANTASRRVLIKAGLKQVDNMMRNGEELAFFRLKRKDNATT